MRILRVLAEVWVVWVALTLVLVGFYGGLLYVAGHHGWWGVIIGVAGVTFVALLILIHTSPYDPTEAGWNLDHEGKPLLNLKKSYDP